MPLTVTSPSESYLKCEEENITETSNGNTAGKLDVCFLISLMDACCHGACVFGPG